MNEISYKYNYVLFTGVGPIHETLKAQYKGMDNVCFVRKGLIRGGKLAQFFHKIHWSAKLNKKIRLPLKKIWYKKMTKIRFNNILPICYVFFGGQYCVQDKGLMNYIKKQNPNNRVVAYLADIHTKEHFDALKENCDFVCTYDKKQAEANSVEHYDAYSYQKDTSNDMLTSDFEKRTEFERDLYFIGYAKDRLEKLLNIYFYLTKNNVCCFFQLAGVPENQRVKGENGLEYLDRDIPYEEVLAHVRDSRCILEVSQGGASGKTLRTEEAIKLRRKLLTDRIETKLENIFSEEQLSVFSSLDEIDVAFIQSDIDYEKCINPDTASNTVFIDFLEDKLSNIVK